MHQLQKIYICNNNPIIDQKGFSLLESMLALGIALYLSYILIDIFIAGNLAYQFNENLIQVQQNAYIVSQALTNEIRMAGYIGCSHLNTNVVSQAMGNVTLSAHNRILGYSSAQLPKELFSLSPAAAPGTDLLVITKMSTNSVPITQITTRSHFLKNTWLIISDCTSAELVRCPNNFASAKQMHIDTQFSDQAEVAPLQKIVFYIGDTQRKSHSGFPILALYRKDLINVKQQQTEVVEGVNNMQIRYGIHTTLNDNINYYPANQIRDWSNVVSVKIKLFLVSSDGNKSFVQRNKLTNESKINADAPFHQEQEIIIGLRE